MNRAARRGRASGKASSRSRSRRYWPSALVVLGVGLGVIAGCGIGDDDTASEESGIRELERRALGRAQPYVPDVYTAADDNAFSASIKARRELGWKVLAKALRPVPLADAANIDAGGKKEVPLFRTWLGGEEVIKVFTKMFSDFGKGDRVSRRAATDAEVNALFDWNATSLGANTEADYFRNLALVTNQPGVDGLAGNARVAYSPGYVRQYLQDYGTMARCEGKLSKFLVKTPPTSQENFTNCFSREFPTDAAVVKMAWRRNDAMVSGIPVVDTTAPSLKKRVAGQVDDGAWTSKNVPVVQAGPEQVYSVQMSDRTGYAMTGLHIMTKELRHWVWVTAWWSPPDKANEDFGQDRPASIGALGSVWANYKMCVVTDYDENDPDPRGGFQGSLGDALEAVHNGSTWCSNPFIEKGPHNAQTNCIGCHQHAGDFKSLEKVLEDPRRHPNQGRTLQRTGFPADYSWAFSTPPAPDNKDRLFDSILARMKAFDADDARR